MNHISLIEKHAAQLKEEVEKLTEYKTTYSEVLPEIMSLLDKLFEEGYIIMYIYIMFTMIQSKI
jgi:hypothetical protein